MAKKKKAKKKKKWIQKAVERPGALRNRAKRMGLIKGDEKLSASDLSTMESAAKERGDTKLLRQINLARTLKKM